MPDIILSEICKTLLESIDVGGEQSRQFEEEIKLLKKLLEGIKSLEKENKKGLAACITAEDFLRSLPYVNAEAQERANEVIDRLEAIRKKA